MRIRGFSYQDLRVLRWSATLTREVLDNAFETENRLFDGGMIKLLNTSIPNYRDVLLCIRCSCEIKAHILYTCRGKIENNMLILKSYRIWRVLDTIHPFVGVLGESIETPTYVDAPLYPLHGKVRR